MDNLHTFMSANQLVDYCYDNNLIIGLNNAMIYNDFDFHYEKVPDGGHMYYEGDICVYVLPEDEWMDESQPEVIPFRNDEDVDVTKTSNWVVYNDGGVLDFLYFHQGAYSSEYFEEYQMKEIAKYFLEFVGIFTISDLLGLIDRGFVLGELEYVYVN